MEYLTALSPVALGFYGSLAAGLMTAFGAIPVLFGSTPSRKWRDISLGFAAGVMLAASFFSLIIPALDAAEIRYGDSAIPALIVCAAILLGMGAVAILNEVIPHEHFSTGREGPEAASLRRVWLFVIAIAIHNAPEGLAVGVAFGADGFEGGFPVALGIGLQNAPEGLAVAVALLGDQNVVTVMLLNDELAPFATLSSVQVTTLVNTKIATRVGDALELNMLGFVSRVQSVNLPGGGLAVASISGDVVAIELQVLSRGFVLEVDLSMVLPGSRHFDVKVLKGYKQLFVI